MNKSEYTIIKIWKASLSLIWRREEEEKEEEEKEEEEEEEKKKERKKIPNNLEHIHKVLLQEEKGAHTRTNSIHNKSNNNHDINITYNENI